MSKVEKEEMMDIIVDYDEENLFTQYNKINEKIKKYERLRDSLKGQIIDITHHANHIYNNDGVEIASWSHQIRQIFDSTRFKIENISTYEKYLKESNVYQLRVIK
jgi:phenylalanyl-tRNA synthetase alpha subunit